MSPPIMRHEILIKMREKAQRIRKLNSLDIEMVLCFIDFQGHSIRFKRPWYTHGSDWKVFRRK